MRLIASKREQGALLMERVNPGTSLVALCASDDRAATQAAASVIAELRSVGTSVTTSLPNLTSWLARLQPEAAGERPLVLEAASRRALSIAGELRSNAELTVLHGDLQHFNILKAERAPWLAIDPKGVIGPSEAEPAALLRNPRRFVLSHSNPRQLLSDRIAILAERIEDDADVLVLWGYVIAVIAAAWAFEDRSTDVEVNRWLRCADILWSVAPENIRRH